jgi:hypothetical protein
MVWKSLLPAIGAGLVGSAVFWWATLLYLCARCESGMSGCEWNGACVAGVGIPLAVVLAAVSVLVPYRLVEQRWPWGERAEED